MPFGLSNAPASFQRYINKILAEKLDIFVIVYLDNILVYNKDAGPPHVNPVRWIMEQLRKHGLYANLKKCRFHQDEVRFLSFVVSAQGIKMEEERIEAVKAWAEPKSVRNIKLFLGFANIYRRFIKGFSKIAGPLTFMLKMMAASPEAPQEATWKVREETGNEVGDGETAKIGGVKLPGGKNSKNLTNVKNFAKSKVPKAMSPGSAPEARPFLIPDARLAFTRLKPAFTEAPIFHYFDPERYIRIETDASGYTISGVLSQLTSDQRLSGSDENSSKSSSVGQLHLVVFFSRKMIPVETQYETHDQELLSIVEAFKNCRHYLEGCKYEVLALIDHNNLRRFMDTKSLSSRQVCWA